MKPQNQRGKPNTFGLDDYIRAQNWNAKQTFRVIENRYVENRALNVNLAMLRKRFRKIV